MLLPSSWGWNAMGRRATVDARSEEIRILPGLLEWLSSSSVLRAMPTHWLV
jgi:hypothetical protein